MKNEPMQTKPGTSDKQESGSALRGAACCASLIINDPSDLPNCDGEILVALWGANEWEIVNVRENVNGPFTAEYKNTGEPADPSEWQWWADLHCIILHNAEADPTRPL